MWFVNLPQHVFGAVVVVGLMCMLNYVETGSEEGVPQGPYFTREPLSRVDFLNSTGTAVACSASGHPSPALSWGLQDGTPLRDVSGLRHVRPDGSLVFPPFSAEMFRQDVHDTVYRCTARNLYGSVVSRDVHVRAVIQRKYKVQVYDEFAVHGNTAVLRCQVPTFVLEYITFVAWKRDDGITITATSATSGGRYSILPTGQLYIREVTQADSLKSFSCQTRHKLSGEVAHSTNSGTLFVTEPHGSSPPKISDSQAFVVANEGESLELACAATGFPPPTYRWFKEENGQLTLILPNHRATQVEGSLFLQYATVQDSGKYACVVNNSVGENRAYTVLTITAPLSVQLLPKQQTVDVGRPAYFNCSVSGHPLRSVTWMKDGHPLDDDVRGRYVLLSRDVLHLPSIQRDDSGMYQCFAFGDAESTQSSAQLKLGDVAPTLLATFTGGAVQPGVFTSLRCSASGNPLPQITWSLDGSSIPDVSRFRVGDFVTSEGHVVSYVNVSDIRVEDGGDYACSASNVLAQASHAARLNVYGPPAVKSRPNITVIAGHSIELSCPVAGYPIGSITWSKDGSLLPTNHRQKVLASGDLLLQDIQKSAEDGTYVCEATGQDERTAIGNVHVRVIVAPKIDPVPIPELSSINEGQKFKVLCNILEGDSPVETSWTKNGRPLLTSDDDITLQKIEDSAILIFRKVSFRHSGNYTCTASNRAAAVNRTTHIVVNVPPRWLVEPTDDFVVLGQKISLGCMADGFPRPQIQWKKAHGKQASDFREILSSYRRQVSDNGSLVLQEVEDEDSGHYMCQASNGIGAGLSKVVFLTIHTPPRFETKFVSHTVSKGQEAHLRCLASGQLPIVVKWEKDKQPLELHSLQHRMTTSDDMGKDSITSVLTISDTTRRDSALYTCIASNKFGVDDTNIQLVVQEAPVAPMEVAVQEKSSRSVVLTWVPGFNGNSPLTKYTVTQYRNVTGGQDSDEEELEQMIVPAADTSATVRGLTPSMRYRFRVSATNALGTSDPSNPVELTTGEEVPGGPPLDIDVRPTGSQSLKVTWTAPRTDLQHGRILGYYIGYKMSSSDDQYQYKNVESSDSQQLTYLTNLRRLTSYKIIVQAYNNVGAGPRSDEVVSTTLEAAPPTSPLLMSISATASSLSLRWERSSDDIMVKDYVLHYKAEGGDWQQEKLSTSHNEYQLRGLKCGTRYRLFMMASNSLGMGEPGDTITTRTKGAAPVSPQRDNFLMVNWTSVSLDLRSWQNGGCPIHHFSIHFRDHRGQWRTVSDRVDISQGRYEVRHLLPSQEYTLRVSAHSDAGTTEAEYRFQTLNVTGSNTKPQSPVLSLDSIFPTAPFYKNLTILLPVVISVVVLLVVVIAVVVCLRKQADTSSTSGDSRKGDSLGLSDFTGGKSLKDSQSFGKSSYYSSPARKAMLVGSSLQRDHLEAHEYAEPYTAVPTPRCVIEADCTEIVPLRGKNDVTCSTVKRSPSRCATHFTATGLEGRVCHQMVDCSHLDMCNPSISSQSRVAGSRINNQSDDGFRVYRQDIS